MSIRNIANQISGFWSNPTSQKLAQLNQNIIAVSKAIKPYLPGTSEYNARPTNPITSYVIRQVESKIPGGFQGAKQRIQSTPLKEFFLPTASGSVPQAFRQYIGDTAKSAVNAYSSASKLTPIYQTLRQSQGNPVSNQENIENLLDFGANALNTTFRVTSPVVAPIFSATLGGVQSLRHNQNPIQGSFQGVNKQLSLGQALTDDPVAQRVIDIASLATMIATPYVSKKLNSLNLSSQEIRNASEVLGVKPSSTLEEISTAYKNKIIKYREVFAGRGTSVEKAEVQKLNDVYNTLKKTNVFQRKYASMFGDSQPLKQTIAGEIPANINERITNKPSSINVNPRASSEANKTLLPWEEPGYQSNNLSTLSQNTKDVAKQIFGDNRVPTSKRGIGAFDPIRSVDNPLLPEQAVINRISQKSAKAKANIVDYLRTPESVFEKLGIQDEFKLLRQGQDNYTKELKSEIDRVTQWASRVPTPESNEKIFKFLDGQKVNLNPIEKEVAREIKTYLSKWADRLDIPYQSRITNYITHIFEKGDIELEFNQDIAKLIDQKVSGSVYDPFLQKREGMVGYVTDTWRALDAYIKRAVRKANLDPALDRIEIASNKLDLESYKYVQKYISGVNMRPTEIDNLIDNWIKGTSIGYKFGQRPVANISGNIRKIISRATLGLNPTSALRNLSQGSNTYAVLGEKNTINGYVTLFKNIAKKDLTELYSNGVLDENIIQDRDLHAVKGLMEKVDPVLYYMFEKAELINRGAAYYGGKAKALSEGISETEAVDYAKKIVRDTQFSFSKIDTPVVLQSDLAKLAAQFGTYSVKQAEFLAGMAKDKNYQGIFRYIAASILFISTVGRIWGMKVQEIFPFFGGFKPPVVQLGENAINTYNSIRKNITDNKWGQTAENVFKTGAMIVPAGSQLKKSIQGFNAVNQGYSETPTGLVRYPIDRTPANYIRGTLFGQYNLPEAQQYFNNDSRPLSEKQSQIFKNAKYETSSDAPQNLIQKGKIYGTSLILNPADTIRAILAGNPIRKVQGDAIVLEREIGLSNLDNGDRATVVDHKIPLTLGGTNDPTNLQLISPKENSAKAQVEVYLSKLLISGKISKSEAQARMRNWKNEIGNLSATQQSKILSEISSFTPVAKDDLADQYGEIMNKREESSQLDQVKEMVKDTSVDTFVGNTYVYLDNGEVKTVDTSFEPTKPNITGNELVDKKLISKYKGEITKKENIILTLYEKNQISADQAEDELAKLKQDRADIVASSNSKRLKKAGTIKITKIKTPSPTIRFKTSTPILSKRLPKIKVSKLYSPKLQIQ